MRRFALVALVAVAVAVAGCAPETQTIERVIVIEPEAGTDTTEPFTDAGNDAVVDAATDAVPYDTTADADTADTDAACPIPDGGACSPFPQCGCPTGDHCSLADNSASTWPQCLTPGPRKINEPCMNGSQCGFGLACMYNLCRPFCTTVADCAEGGSGMTCAGFPYSDGKIRSTLCLRECDPRTPEPDCGKGNGCTFHESDKTICTTAGKAVEGDACPTGNECGPGLTCRNHGGLGPKCHSYCAALADCRADQACTPIGKTYLLMPFGYCAPK